MPILSTFYGIIIRIFFSDHHPPHFHAEYQDSEAIFSLDGDILQGNFPNKQASMVKAWALIHEDELKAAWKLASENEPVFRIDPLR